MIEISKVESLMWACFVPGLPSRKVTCKSHTVSLCWLGLFFFTCRSGLVLMSRCNAISYTVCVCASREFEGIYWWMMDKIYYTAFTQLIMELIKSFIF